MENKKFLEKINDLFNDDKVFFITNCDGETLILDIDDGDARDRVKLIVLSINGTRELAGFNIKDFIWECKRLHLNYMTMLLNVIMGIVQHYHSEGYVPAEYRYDTT